MLNLDCPSVKCHSDGTKWFLRNVFTCSFPWYTHGLGTCPAQVFNRAGNLHKSFPVPFSPTLL